MNNQCVLFIKIKKNLFFFIYHYIFTSKEKIPKNKKKTNNY
jgi:hypothetical protein